LKEPERASDIEQESELLRVLNSRDRVAVLFYASWCPFSRRFLPLFKEKAGDKDCFARVVINDDEALAEKYSINVYPTVIFFEKGKISKRLDGRSGAGLNEKELADFINKCGLE
jgi:thiol-disulfide isomerase/thioredoxin